jgi:hypothetical protein
VAVSDAAAGDTGQICGLLTRFSPAEISGRPDEKPASRIAA